MTAAKIRCISATLDGSVPVADFSGLRVQLACPKSHSRHNSANPLGQWAKLPTAIAAGSRKYFDFNARLRNVSNEQFGRPGEEWCLSRTMPIRTLL